MQRNYIILFLVLSLSANAQWKLTPYLGSNLSTVRFIDPAINDNSLDAKPLFNGIEIGVLASYQWQDKWQLTTGLALAQRGYKAKFSESNDSVSLKSETELSLTYFEVPLLLSHKIWQNKKHELHVHGGFYAGIGATGRFSFFNSTTTKNENTLITEQERAELGVTFVQSINPGNFRQLSQNQFFAQKLRAGLNTGVHYHYNQWGLRLSYLLQLTNIHSPIKPEEAALFPVRTDKLSTVQIAVSYTFPLASK